MEVIKIILATVSRFCQLSSHKCEFLSDLIIFNSIKKTRTLGKKSIRIAYGFRNLWEICSLAFGFWISFFVISISDDKKSLPFGKIIFLTSTSGKPVRKYRGINQMEMASYHVLLRPRATNISERNAASASSNGRRDSTSVSGNLIHIHTPIFLM